MEPVGFRGGRCLMSRMYHMSRLSLSEKMAITTSRALRALRAAESAMAAVCDTISPCLFMDNWVETRTRRTMLALGTLMRTHRFPVHKDSRSFRSSQARRLAGSRTLSRQRAYA